MDMMNREILWLGWTGLHMTPWKLIGLAGALMFGLRWVVQFLASDASGLLTGAIINADAGYTCI